MRKREKRERERILIFRALLSQVTSLFFGTKNGAVLLPRFPLFPKEKK